MKQLKGMGVSHGIAIGRALLILDENTVVVEESIEEDSLEKEISHFLEALETAKVQIKNIREKVKGKIGDENAFIFDTHIMLLNDSSLKGETLNFIGKHRCNASWAFSQVLMNILKGFSSLGDSYFRERGNDLRDVGKRVLKVMRGAKEFGFKNLTHNVIVIGSEFGPSNITHFDHPHILGFATDVGAQTTHTAIIAKALGLPAVVGLHNITKQVQSGDTIILDSFSGKVIINPDVATLAKYGKLIRIYQEEDANYLKDISEPAVSKDDLEIQLLANIELPHEVNGALTNGARGVGLYRTEFLFLKYDPELPTESDQYETYCTLAQSLGDLPLTIRTLDMGGEKFFHRTFVREKEVNPVMGLRGVRLCLQRKDIFRTQLRAILRAAHHHKNIKIMFPLLSGVKEWRTARDFLQQIQDELREEGVPFEEKPVLGVMIEVPAAAMVADHLAKEVAFFSIGTNDLIQYFLAIDRANDDVSYLYDPFHPGFVRLLSMVIDAANQAGIEVNCCGETASSPIYACLLILLGLKNLSMNPSSLPIIHHMIRVMDFERLRQLVKDPTREPIGQENKLNFNQAIKTLLNEKDFQHLISEQDKRTELDLP